MRMLNGGHNGDDHYFELIVRSLVAVLDWFLCEREQEEI